MFRRPIYARNGPRSFPSFLITRLPFALTASPSSPPPPPPFLQNFGIGKDNLPSFFVLDFPSQKHWVLEAKGGLRVWATQEVAEDTLAAFLVDVVEGKVGWEEGGA